MAVLLAVIIATMTGLVTYFEGHFWLIPVFVLINVLICWWLIKNLVLKSFLFSYGQDFITSRELKSLNE